MLGLRPAETENGDYDYEQDYDYEVLKSVCSVESIMFSADSNVIPAKAGIQNTSIAEVRYVYRNHRTHGHHQENRS